jgi:hypothetical protein
MSLNTSGGERHAKTLRAWQLAILPFAVTLDNADGLTVMAIAGEIDKLGPEHNKPDFSFFGKPVRISALQFYDRMNLLPTSYANILRRSTKTASSMSSRQQSKPTNRWCLWSANLSSATTAYAEATSDLTRARAGCSDRAAYFMRGRWAHNDEAVFAAKPILQLERNVIWKDRCRQCHFAG